MTITATHRTELREAIIQALDVPGMSQNQLAKQMGVSAATVISIKTEDWEKVSDKMVSQLRAYFRLDNWGLRKTHNFEVINALCEDAAGNRRFLAVAGYTGAGKTTALRYYAQHHAATFYVLATVVHTKRTFLKAIQQSMGLNEGHSIWELMDSIIRKLKSLPGALLIIDDGGKLSQTCMRLLQVIYDETEYSAGIVLAGTEYLKDEIDRQARRNTMGYRELQRRIAYWQPLHRPAKKVVTAICQDYGISEPTAVSFINEHAADYGTLRNLILNATALAARENIPVTRELLADVHVGDGAYMLQTA
jgi:DNA transposition AAA+ family ATPase